jgi:DNA methyltransferase 1-associated protein 1
MAAADVRAMLDLPAEGQQQPRPHKKQKVVEKRPGSFMDPRGRKGEIE